MALLIVPDAEILPGYRLIERIGRGGFGEVWKAEAPGGMQKAIKFVYGNLDDATEDGRPAEQELKALNRVKSIRHPFILSLEQFKVVEGQLCIVMELADRNLYDRFRECQKEGLPGIPRDELLRYMDEAAEALDLMNNHYQLQHLDIKPQNLFLMFNHIKVADFGLAKDMEGLQATLTGGVTPVYAAPETFEGHVSRYCDQYSLAIVFQEMLTGQRPFAGVTAKQLMLQHLQNAPDLTALPTSDQAVMRRALAKKPDDRYPLCADMVRALREAARAPVSVSMSLGAAPPTVVAMTPVDHPVAPSPLPPPTYDSRLLGLLAGTGSVLPEGGKLPALTAAVVPRVAASSALANARPTPPEQAGDGALIPTLIVGLGQMGLFLVHRLRRAIRDRFGTAALPHMRFFYIDTDPETVQLIDPKSTTAPGPRETYLARLNRPSHYSRPASGQVGVDSWLHPQLLFRIPRNPATTGLRAFGRLAFHDHYRQLMPRLKAELETMVADEALAEADRITGLGLRTNRPRVYILSSLVGGTGSGMFLDLAYTLRFQLKMLGYRHPDVQGLFLIPAVDRTTPKSQGIANAYAALVELAHYNSPRTTYEATFDPKEGPIVDPARPFEQCVLLQMPKSHDLPALRPVVGTATGLLFRELLTPFGRNADRARAEVSVSAPTASWFVNIGTYRLAWPRTVLQQRAARRCCERLLQIWTVRETDHLAEPVATWLGDEWARRQLQPDALHGRLREACRVALPDEPEAVFDGFVAQLDDAREHVNLQTVDVSAALDRVIHMVGPPEAEVGTAERGSLDVLLEEVVRKLTAENETKLAEMAVGFIEQPGYRLAGAEEAIRQLVGRLRATLDKHEPALPTVRKESADLYAKLLSQVSTLDSMSRGSRRGALVRDTLANLRAYPRKRLECHLLKSLIDLYRAMLNYAPDCLREVQFCRQRIETVRARFDQPSTSSDIESYLGPGKPILPEGCRNVDAAAWQFVDGLAPDDFMDLDAQIQARVRKEFKTLVNFCLEKSDKPLAMAELLLDEARNFLEPRFRQTNSASVFFQNRAQEQAAYRDIMQAFDEACPDMIGSRTRKDYQACLLSVPDDPDGVRFAQIAGRMVTDSPVTTFAGTDDIVFHRELHLAPADLPQLGAFAKEAFTHVTHTDQATPHARVDVRWMPVEDKTDRVIR